MPLFDFYNGSGQEFEFGDGTYCLRRFDPNTDIPKNDIPGLSEMDIQYIKQEQWALVAENPDLKPTPRTSIGCCCPSRYILSRLLKN
jgi:hypothetical protein